MLDAVGDPKRFISFLDKEDKIGFKNKDPFRRFWIGDTLLVHALSTEARKVIIDSSVEINKGTNYDFLIDWLGKGLLTSDGSKWKHRRRILTPTFHFKTAMGVKIHAQDNPDQPYINAVQRFAFLADNHFKNIFYKIPFVYYIFGYGFERDRTLKVLKDFTNDVIKKKTKEFEANSCELKDNTFLSNLLQLKSENKWTDEGLREEVDTFMFGGHYTTSSALTYCFWALAHFQDV
uniref:Cytochrome P450 n=1 Tax=Parastrongyloides trichosuri TaxID=131310 RepID=A0A0N4ZZY1_PARTI